jgi:hypothetical protein
MTFARHSISIMTIVDVSYGTLVVSRASGGGRNQPVAGCIAVYGK